MCYCEVVFFLLFNTPNRIELITFCNNCMWGCILKFIPAQTICTTFATNVLNLLKDLHQTLHLYVPELQLAIPTDAC